MFCAGTPLAISDLSEIERQHPSSSHKSFKDTLASSSKFVGITPSANSPPPSFNKERDIFIPLPPEVYSDLCSPWVNAIISKASGASFSSEYFISSVAKLWKIQPNQTSSLGKGFFVSNLSSEAEVSRVLSSGPWFLNGTFISTQKWQPGFRVSEAKDNLLPIWVELPEIPVEFLVEPILKSIGNSLGRFIKADMKSISEKKLRFARLLVLMDTSLGKKEYVWLGKVKQPIVFHEWPVTCGECAAINRHTKNCSKIVSRNQPIINHPPTQEKAGKSKPTKPTDTNPDNLQKIISINPNGQKETNWTIIPQKKQKAHLQKPTQKTHLLLSEKEGKVERGNRFLALCQNESTNSMGKGKPATSYTITLNNEQNPHQKIFETTLSENELLQLVNINQSKIKNILTLPVTTKFKTKKQPKQYLTKKNTTSHHGISFSSTRERNTQIPSGSHFQQRFHNATSTPPQTNPCHPIPSYLHNHTNTTIHDLPRGLAKQIQFFLPRYIGGMVSSEPLDTKRNITESCSSPSTTCSTEDDSPPQLSKLWRDYCRIQ